MECCLIVEVRDNETQNEAQFETQHETQHEAVRVEAEDETKLRTSLVVLTFNVSKL